MNQDGQSARPLDIAAIREPVLAPYIRQRGHWCSPSEMVLCPTQLASKLRWLQLVQQMSALHKATAAFRSVFGCPLWAVRDVAMSPQTLHSLRGRQRDRPSNLPRRREGPVQRQSRLQLEVSIDHTISNSGMKRDFSHGQFLELTKIPVCSAKQDCVSLALCQTTCIETLDRLG